MDNSHGSRSSASPRYLTLDEIMSPDITLEELLDAPWAYDGKSLRQYFTEAFTAPVPA